MNKTFFAAGLFVSCSLLFPVLTGAENRFPKPGLALEDIHVHKTFITWESESKVDHYQMKLLASDGTTVLRTVDIDKDKTRKKIKNLDPETTYFVRMRAHFKNGTHDKYSKKRQFTTLPDHPRYSANFINYLSSTAGLEDATQPAAIEATYNDLGTDAFRQMTSGDLIWSNVQLSDGTFDFTVEDSVLMHTDHTPIVTLLDYQYADGLTPWESLMGGDPVTTFTSEVEDYVGTTVDHYKGYVKYWELGNEMAHWELTDPGVFPAAEQGEFMKEVANTIKEHDPDAVILIPGMLNITTDNVDDWLPEFVSTAGTDWFDVVGYHDYNDWRHFSNERAALQTVLDDLGISDKPVWMTENGTSSDASNSARTNYPNSEDEQAADVFRRSIQAYAAGDELVGWHTLIGNDDEGEEFAFFGLINEDLTIQKAYYATQLLTSEVLPFVTVTKLSNFTYQVVRNDQSVRYVAWSGTTGTYTVPDDMTQMTSVVPNSDGSYTWTEVAAGEEIDLTNIPVVLR